tara:strand:- start:241 stop:555 length:315 start_codon:yes stop_codon:yes gene_type:complete
MISRLKNLLLIPIFFLFSVNSYSLPFSEYEKVELYCHFFPENEPTVILGRMIGISNCQDEAFYYAEINNLVDTDWDYIGCTIKKPLIIGGVIISEGSDCHEKIR